LGKWTGIPVSRLIESEREKLLRMEDQLRHRVVGQGEAGDPGRGGARGGGGGGGWARPPPQT